MIKINKPNKTMSEGYKGISKFIQNGILIDYLSGKYNENIFEHFFDKNIVYRPYDEHNINLFQNTDATTSIQRDNVTCISLINVLSKLNAEETLQVLGEVNEIYQTCSHNLIKPPTLYFFNTKGITLDYISRYFPTAIQHTKNRIIVE